MQKVEDYESSGEDVYQLYEFNSDQQSYDNQYKLRFDDDGNLPQNDLSGDFVMRHRYSDAGGDNADIAYQEGVQVVVPHEDVDTERYVQTGSGHKSIDYVPHQQGGDPKFLQLYNFNSYGTTSDASGLSANGDGVLIRKKSSSDNHLELQYLNIVGLKKLVDVPNLSALNGLSVVTGIEYDSQYRIAASRSKINVDANNNVTVTPLPTQYIETIPHS